MSTSGFYCPFDAPVLRHINYEPPAIIISLYIYCIFCDSVGVCIVTNLVWKFCNHPVPYIKQAPKTKHIHTHTYIYIYIYVCILFFRYVSIYLDLVSIKQILLQSNHSNSLGYLLKVGRYWKPVSKYVRPNKI